MDEIRKKIKRIKQWKALDGKEAKIYINLDEVRVQHFRNLNRLIGGENSWPGCYYKNYIDFWAWKGGEPEIRNIIVQLKELYKDNYQESPSRDRKFANFIKSFANIFSYQYDDKSIGYDEYGKFPIGVLYDEEGDCDCLSFLLASLFVHAGFSTTYLFGYTKPGRRGYHAAVGIVLPNTNNDDILEREGILYSYCEAVSPDPVGKCAFDFDIFKRDAAIIPVEVNYNWNGIPPSWSCRNGCGLVPPDQERCPVCGELAIFTQTQQEGDEVVALEKTLKIFQDWISWARQASLPEIAREIENLYNTSIWENIPSGNKNYLENTLNMMRSNDWEKAQKYISGARQHLLSAWPHISASIFSHEPKGKREGYKVYNFISSMGKNVYELNNEQLLIFTKKILSDTICKRVLGFGSGSRSALGKIIEAYERRCGEEARQYLSQKRKSIENILVKVIIPQVFSLLAREAKQQDVESLF